MFAKRYLALLPLMFLGGCELQRPPEDVYRESLALFYRGEVGKAIDVADRGWLRWKDRPSTEWRWKFGLLEVELLRNQGRITQASQLLEALGNSPPTGELNARFVSTLAIVKRDRSLADKAFALASRENDLSLLSTIELRRATVDGYTGRSEPFIRNALALAQRKSDKYLEARALGDFGYQRLNLSRFDEAIPWLEQAVGVARQAGADRVRERTLGNLGWCYHRLGDSGRALSSLLEAAKLARELKDDDYLHRWLNDVGNIYLWSGDFSQAISYYQQAADLAKRLNNVSWLTIILGNLAEASTANGDLESAERFNKQAGALIGITHNVQSLLYSQLRTAKIESARKQSAAAEASYRAVIESATQQRMPFVLWEAEAGLAKQLHAGGRDAEADSQYRKALGTIESEWSRLGEDRHKVTFLAQLISFYGDYIDFLVDRRQPERAAAVADSSRARVLAERLGNEPGAGQASTRPMKAGPILLSYWLAPARSYLWLIGPRGTSQYVLPGERRIADLVKQYSAAIEKGHDPMEMEHPAGSDLYQILIAPARGSIPAGASVIVVPDGCLHGLNFETLIVDGPSRHYWIDDVTLAVAPAISLLQTRASRRAIGGKLLLLGDPEAADPAFPALPNLKREAKIVEDRFPLSARTVLTGKQANPGAYREAHPGDYSLIHFAAHAVANAESPLNSAVILSKTGEDYKLYAKDVLDQPLQADLVTISACRSAGGKSYAGEGLVGFTWAFLQAGARNVVAGLWDADDAATAELMGEFYKQLSAGATPAVALALAKRKLLKSKGPNRIPYYWGAFQVFTREFTACRRL